SRTTGQLARLPFFGGGVTQLLHYLRPMEQSASNGRRSALRSALDENYVSYRGGQLWKLNFNGTRRTDVDSPPDAHYNQFVENMLLLWLPRLLLLAAGHAQHLLLWRSITLPGLGLPQLWTMNSSELYEATFESLQWLAPTDLRRFDFISADSTYQINRRYRNDSRVRRYYGYQLWKLHEDCLDRQRWRVFRRLFGSSVHLSFFHSLFNTLFRTLLAGSEVWNINQDGIDILIEHKNVEAAQKFMEKSDFSYNVMIDDIEAAIDQTYTEVSDEQAESANANYSLPWLQREGSLLTWRRYHDHGDLQQFLQNTLETHADLAEIIQIGLTRNKRPMEVLRISNGNRANWSVFVDAGLQARDWLSPAALSYAIAKLTWLWGEGQLERAMRRIDWYFLPLANPDGYQYSRLTDRLWTKNRNYDIDSGCYGVNLDRNFEYAWGGAGATQNACKNLYQGSKSFSEPESRAIRNFLLGMRNDLGAYISLGGYGQTITYPWGDADYLTHNERQLRHTARQAVLNFRRLNHAEYSMGTSYTQKMARAGNSADWVQQRINPQFVYNVFLKDLGRYGYLMPPHYILESGEEAFEFLRTIAEQLN
ncbi:CG42264, partial [Drosophila busckii]